MQTLLFDLWQGGEIDTQCNLAFEVRAFDLLELLLVVAGIFETPGNVDVVAHGVT